MLLTASGLLLHYRVIGKYSIIKAGCKACFFIGHSYVVPVPGAEMPGLCFYL